MARLEALFTVTGNSSGRQFQAGIVLHDDRVAEVGEIVSFLKGMPSDRLVSFCQERGWSCEKVWSNE